jgi:hypothetical protein
MKKIFLSLCFAVATLAGFSQTGTITLSPTAFTAEDEVTITVDVTGTGMAGETESYIWIWANANAAGFTPKDGVTTNTAWGNSPDAAKMTRIANNRFQFKFVATTLFQLSPAQLKHFQFLCKSKTGNKQTSDASPMAFDPLTFVPTVTRVFPSKVGQDDAVTIYFHQALATVEAEKRMVPTNFIISVADVNGNTVGGGEQTVTLVDEGNGVFSYSFIPTQRFTIPANVKLGKLRFRIKGTGRDAAGQPINVETGTTEKNFDL